MHKPEQRQASQLVCYIYFPTLQTEESKDAARQAANRSKDIDKHTEEVSVQRCKKKKNSKEVYRKSTVLNITFINTL
jgi:hypothetical protein